MARTITDYVIELWQYGYTSQQIRAKLIREGYTPAQATKAIQQAAHKKPHIQMKWMLAIGGLVVLIFVILLALQFLSDTGTTAPSLRMQMSLTNNQVMPGEELSFDLQLTPRQSVTIALQYDVTSILTKEKIITQRETITISSASTKRVTLPLPATIARGTYVATTTADFNEERKTTFSNFKVIGGAEEEPTPEPTPQPIPEVFFEEEEEVIEPVVIEDFPEQTGPVFEGGTEGDTLANTFNQNEWSSHMFLAFNERTLELSFTDTQETYTVSTNTAGMVTAVTSGAAAQGTPKITAQRQWMNDALDLNNPTTVARWCTAIQDEISQDACWNELAQASLQSAFCESITNVGVIDECFGSFAIRGDFSVCDKLISPDLRASCNALKSAE